jgi:hypothetical protein
MGTTETLGVPGTWTERQKLRAQDGAAVVNALVIAALWIVVALAMLIVVVAVTTH